MLRLADLKVGESGKIIKIACGEKTIKRLADLGVCVGVKITLVRVSPFNDPLEIKARDFYLAIRRIEAKKIILERL